MGNQACNCCEQNENLPEVNLNIKVSRIQPVQVPKLKQPVLIHLQHYQPFKNQVPDHIVTRRFGQDVYAGKINNKGRPDGFGTMYFKNGCVFIGHFCNGKAHGMGHYVLEDGSFYHGDMKENRAEGTGEFHCKTLKYIGQFKNNLFHGVGKEEGINYGFTGIYSEGKRKSGLLKWQQINSKGLQKQNLLKSSQPISDSKTKQSLLVWPISSQIKEETIQKLEYNGEFDQNEQFAGNGCLKNSKGEYTGQFLNGKKHGKGTFVYFSGAKFEGEYCEGNKKGFGTAYSKNGKISYCGEWDRNLPNGKGYVLNQFNDKVQLNWIDGIDQRVL